jgi:hypothetical protein
VSVFDVFAPLAGKRIPGGCDRCDAFQTLNAVDPGVWSLTVHHDDWCPVLRAMKARTS